jgi:hypothetical protein
MRRWNPLLTSSSGVGVFRREPALRRRVGAAAHLTRNRVMQFWRLRLRCNLPKNVSDAAIASIGGEAVEPAGASGVDKRLFAAPLAHMCRIPRRVPAARPVGVAEHGARPVCRYFRRRVCRPRQGHAVRGPVVAGVIGAVGERPAGGVRASHCVVLVGARGPSSTGNLVPLGIEVGRLLDVVPVALLVAMQIGDIAGDQLALDVVPGAGADASARIDPRRVAALFLAEIGVPRFRGGGPAQRLGLGLAHLVGAREPAEIARAVRVLGNEEARGLYRRLLLGLRQRGRRSQNSDGHGGKNDPSHHWLSSLVPPTRVHFRPQYFLPPLLFLQKGSKLVL